ncbi:molybdopterin-binding protein [Glutamicibacter halophytocola]|uniref:MogA/MoaB family molybdenum cofactor biosynthesis protein n=1 Tax=Glutamicibacter halophytocola TaxID=1933880 RepID=UPI003219649A
MKTSRHAAVVVASTSAAAGTAQDKTGPMIARWLAERGFEVPGPVVVADGQPVRFAVDDLLADDAQVIIVTGGTGVSPDDQSPEMVAPAAGCAVAWDHRGHSPPRRAEHAALDHHSRGGRVRRQQFRDHLARFYRRGQRRAGGSGSSLGAFAGPAQLRHRPRATLKNTMYFDLEG